MVVRRLERNLREMPGSIETSNNAANVTFPGSLEGKVAIIDELL